MSSGDYILVLDGNGEVQTVSSDYAFPIKDITHIRTHEGKMYAFSHLVPDVSPIADNASLSILISVGANEANIVFAASVGGACEIIMTEGVTTSSDGTALSVLNMNRNSVNTSTLTAFHTPVSPTGGTTLTSGFFLEGGTGPHASGGGTDFDREWILKANTKYLIVITNRSGAAIPMSSGGNFYEEA